MANPLLDVQNLTISFKNSMDAPTEYTPVVHGVNFHINKGEVVCLVGESGSGKSLSALAVMGLLPAHNCKMAAKKLIFAGQDLQTLEEEAYRKLRGCAMSMVFQEPMTSLNPVFTVGDQVAEVLQIHKPSLSAKERKAQVLSLFKKVQIDSAERRYYAYPHELSGGQRQRVMIAMALAMRTQLLIADEPTTALDVTVQKEILELITHLKDEFSLSVLFITHDFGVVKDLADRVVVMQNGRVVEEGAVKNIMQQPQQAYTKELLAAMPQFNPEGRKNALQKDRKCLLQAKGVQKVFEVRQKGFFSKKMPFIALKGASFELYEGESLGIVGESGSGKSTLARCVIGLYALDGGTVTFQGQNMAGLGAKALKTLRRDMQMVFQDPFSSLNPRMRVGESVGEGLRAYNVMPKVEREAFVKELLADCGLPEGSYDRYPHQFSGGQRQRICIARALSLRPKVIIADEAVSALDVSIQKQILELLETLKQKYNLSYLFISHDLRVVSEVCDRVLVMRQGEIVEQGQTSEVFVKPKHRYTKQLLSALPGAHT